MTSSARWEPGPRHSGEAREKPYVPIPMDQVDYLVATAARAPSVHNTQPWRFFADTDAIELHADDSRNLRRVDPARREMLISCGAALFGLRLAVRRLGYIPVTEMFPSETQRDLLARVRLGPQVPASPAERAFLKAVSHRHTHRGPFSPDRLPRGLLPGLQHDAVAEGATLVLLPPSGYQALAEIVAAADRLQRQQPVLRAELRRWTRPAGSPARDGIPAYAFPASPPSVRGRLALRDFDLGRGWGQLDGAGGYPPAVTAVLTTNVDDRAGWMRAGQALHRLLVHAASQWVFASLHTQALEYAALRAQIRALLGLGGAPQIVLQFGRADTAPVTARRPLGELLVSA
ncbi:MAG: Acg family FMN-binding oxidoreductase [Micromonosporaceae bacterium]